MLAVGGAQGERAAAAAAAEGGAVVDRVAGDELGAADRRGQAAAAHDARGQGHRAAGAQSQRDVTQERQRTVDGKSAGSRKEV